MLPYPQLAAAAAGFGHNYFALDADGPLRHTVPFIRAPKGVALPSLGLAAALKASGVTGDQVAMRDDRLTIAGQRIPLAAVRARTPDGLESFYWRPIAFRGPALLDDMKSRPYPSYPFYDLLYSEEQILAGEKPKVDPAVFKDKIVFVGVTASGLFDVFETPFERGKMPGIQIHAAVADDLLSRRSIAQVSRTAAVFITLALSLAVGLIAAYLPAWWAVLATFTVVGGFVWTSVLFFARGTWLPLTEPLLSSSIALFGGVAYQYFVEGREKRKISKLFGRYVSKDVYSQLMADPERAQLGGRRREMTVLFSDIRGFTTLTEQGQPEVIVRTLNEYFTRMVDLVFLHKGTLDKFVGDMVMALFGAPLDDADHADHAVETALDMVAELARLNERWKAEGLPELDIGIGINTGPMIAGNIGSDAIMSYTVIGDAVNLGARLESLNKQYGTRIIISDATRQQLKRPLLASPARRGRRERQVASGIDIRSCRSGCRFHGEAPDGTRGTCMNGLIVAAVLMAFAAPAYAQLGGLGGALKKAADQKQELDDLTISESEERQIGEDVSGKIRSRFGVVQDPAIHKYVSLVGTALVQQSERPQLPWTFIVLDTDGVNAFASPGGFMHITRGALG